MLSFLLNIYYDLHMQAYIDVSKTAMWFFKVYFAICWELSNFSYNVKLSNKILEKGDNAPLKDELYYKILDILNMIIYHHLHNLERPFSLLLSGCNIW